MTTHTKQQQDNVFETDFIDSQESDPPFAHLLALSHICTCDLIHCVLVLYWTVLGNLDVSKVIVLYVELWFF